MSGFGKIQAMEENTPGTTCRSDLGQINTILTCCHMRQGANCGVVSGAMSHNDRISANDDHDSCNTRAYICFAQSRFPVKSAAQPACHLEACASCSQEHSD